jgi:hypothetical protein
MKKQLILLMSVISIVASLVTPGISGTPTYMPGVTANMVATYSFSGTSPYGASIAIHIRNVSASIVTYRRDNSTTNIQFNVSNVIVHSPWWFVPKNMIVSDMFQPSNPNYLVNAIITKTAAGQSWTAVRLNRSISGIDINACFDQATGLMLYWRYDSSSIHDTFVLASLEDEPPGELPVDPALIVAMLTFGLAIAIFLSMRKSLKLVS